MATILTLGAALNAKEIVSNAVAKILAKYAKMVISEQLFLNLMMERKNIATHARNAQINAKHVLKKPKNVQAVVQLASLKG